MAKLPRILCTLMTYITILWTCIVVLYLTSSANIIYVRSGYTNDATINSASMRDLGKQPTQHQKHSLLENELLQAVDTLSFKTVSTSPVLLQHSYFTPSTFKHVDYNNSFIREPREGCRSSDYLLVLIPSRPGSSSERQAIRDTWGSVARGKKWPWIDHYLIRLVFVLGNINMNSSMENLNISKQTTKFSESEENTWAPMHSNTARKLSSSNSQVENNAFKLFGRNVSSLYDSETEAENRRNDDLQNTSLLRSDIDLLTEIELYDDILLIDMIDSYTNLTIKIISAFQWVVRACKNVKYILKVDQDIFVNIPLIITFLKNYGKPNTIYGEIIVDAEVFREGKWAVSNTILPISHYPEYASGNAYILSGDTVHKLLQIAPYFSYIPIEDAFITGILASVIGIYRVHVNGFTVWIEAKPHFCEFVNNKRYVGNRFTEDHHRSTWKRLIDKGSGRCNLCMYFSWVVEHIVFTSC